MIHVYVYAYIPHIYLIALFNPSIYNHWIYSLIYSCIYIYYINVWGMNVPFAEQSHVVLSPTFLWGAHHAHAMLTPSRARGFGLHNSGRVRVRVLLASEQG